MTKQDTRKFYIGGEWVDPVEPSNLEVINPATEKSVATISLGSVDDINLAVEAARRAFETYSATSNSDRLDLLQNILNIYKKRYDEMAEIISLE
ncbi:MAG: aldehyde dehydrogenase family protein, partial [Lysobacterales bacterium]